MIALIILFIFLFIASIGLLYSAYRAFVSLKVFKYDPTNPYHRTCKKCGSHQNQYHTSYNSRDIWWARMYPIGNNENCICHSFTEDRE